MSTKTDIRDLRAFAGRQRSPWAPLVITGLTSHGKLPIYKPSQNPMIMKPKHVASLTV